MKDPMKGVRMPQELITRIERITKLEYSSFSQFIRTAVVNELSRRKQLHTKLAR